MLFPSASLTLVLCTPLKPHPLPPHCTWERILRYYHQPTGKRKYSCYHPLYITTLLNVTQAFLSISSDLSGRPSPDGERPKVGAQSGAPTESGKLDDIVPRRTKGSKTRPSGVSIANPYRHPLEQAAKDKPSRTM
jgi:hypothetical protein